ncbi:protein melted-like [Paramacrobiotus metropolitanus]|uniref:protein melted-like n=1 Tax=Paramacrobiotus metropolitanus TaxID=2943436 RepID=UPI00244586B5|nr:protein melted-like [Paramacrobiotus metropolitanus]
MNPLFARVLQFSDLSVAGDLFSIPNDEVLSSLNEVLAEVEVIIDNASYATNINHQNVVEICVTRATAAVRETDSLSRFAPALLDLLQKCFQKDLASGATGVSSPYAKIASDLINCVFMGYMKPDVMKQALPIGIRFLVCSSPELARNVSCYLSLIAIQQPFLIYPYVGDFIHGALAGYSQLIRILPQLYTVNSKPVLENVEQLAKLLPLGGNPEKDSLLSLFALVAREHPQALWSAVSDIAALLNDGKFMASTFRLFTQIAKKNPIPFLTNLIKLKKAVDADRSLFPAAITIFGAISRLGENVARDCLQFLISRSGGADHTSLSYLAKEIKDILELYPNLASETDGFLSKNFPGGAASFSSLSYSDNNHHNYDSDDPLPPYHATDYGLSAQKSLVSQQSLYSPHLYGMGKTAVDVRQISTAGMKFPPNGNISASSIPAKLSFDNPIKSLNGSRGSVVANAAARNSHQSLASKGNSRHSLASSGLISMTNQKGSRQSVTANRSKPELLSKSHLPALSPIYSRPEDQMQTESDPNTLPSYSLSTFTVENPVLSKSAEAINVRARRNSRHSLAPRPRSRILETTDQPQVIQVVPIHDAVYQFCDRNLEKIRKYMASVFVKFPLPARCSVEQHKSHKYCKLYFSCQCKGDQCLYASRYFSFRTKIPKVWIHLMFLAIQARAAGALNQQDSAVHALKLCWDHLDKGRDFSTLVTSAFPSSREQEDLLKELSSSRYFDVFEYNATINQWGCFLCNYPEKVTTLFANGTPMMEGVLKEKKGRWTFLRRWRSRYFTLSGPFLSYKSSTDKVVPIDMRRIRSVKPINARGIRSIPTVFELFTNDNKVFLLKAKDPSNAEQWMQCLQIAMAQSQSAEEYGHIF